MKLDGLGKKLGEEKESPNNAEVMCLYGSKQP